MEAHLHVLVWMWHLHAQHQVPCFPTLQYLGQHVKILDAHANLFYPIALAILWAAKERQLHEEAE